MAMVKTDESIVHLEAGEFRWEEIPGKGRCLVPVPPAPKVTARDVESTRRYRNVRDKEIQIVCVYTPENRRFFTAGCSPKWTYSMCAYYSAQELADQINMAGAGSDLAFREWVGQ